ncbi:pilus assembly protein [Lysobacter sp. F60174L2]|uniref:pilus assembly protein n=1 Tax=Lysobacter sp. F60174L2 TaxID=3459295 RepID=UPI00403DC355
MQIQRRIGGRRQRGQGMTEYIIITALIAIAAIAVVTLFGGTVRNQMSGMAKELSGQSATPQIGDAKNTANQSANEAKKTKGMDAYNNK